MAKKQFEIQGSTLRIGGVDIEAGTTSVVIPGVTQVTSYRVDEVEDPFAQTEHFFTVPTVIDAAQFRNLSGDYTSYSSFEAAVYEVQELDDDGFIDGIDVESEGNYDALGKNFASGDMYATEVADAIANFNAGDWTPISFRVKFKAGDVENIGGGGADTGEITFQNSIIIGDGEISLAPFEGDIEESKYLRVRTGDQDSHLHLDTGNNSNYDLYLGDDSKYVRVAKDEKVVIGVDGAYEWDPLSGKRWTFDSTGAMTFPDGSKQTGSLAPQLTKVDDEILLTGTLHLGQSAGGSISEFDTQGNANIWFNSATGDMAGRKYAVGNDDTGTEFLICFGTDGSTVWTYIFDQIDFGGSIGQQMVYPFVIKHWTDTNDNNAEYIYVGFDSSSYIGVAKFAIDGTKVMTWVYTHSLDPATVSFDQHDMVIDPDNGNFTIVGRMYGEWVTYDPIAPQTGSSESVLVVDRADLNNPTGIYSYDTTDWLIDVDGNGSWYQPANGGINTFYNLGLYSVSGNGGQQIYQDPSHYSTGGIQVDATGTPFLKLYSANWTDTGKRDFLLSLGAGQEYSFVCAPSSLYTFTASDVWVPDGSDWTLQGSFSQVAGDSLSTVVNIASIYFNATATGNLRYYIDSNGISSFDGFETFVPGSGYTNGEQVKINGSLLGGVDGGIITSLNSVSAPVDNTWFFNKNDYPTLDVDAPAGTLIRQSSTGAIGTVVSVTEVLTDVWYVVVAVTKGTPATDGTMEFYAGNDLIANYYGNLGYVYWMPVQDVVRFTMDQPLAELSTYNIKRSSGDQAFIYSPDFYHTIGSEGNQGFNSVSLDLENGIVYALGDFNISNGADYVITAFDYANGDILWQKQFDDGMGWSRAYGLVADGATNCLYVPWENDDGDYIVTKISKDGDQIWSVRQTELNGWDNAPQPLLDSNGDLLLVGALNIYNELQDYWEDEIAVVKLSKVDGSLIFGNSLTRLTTRTGVREYYDSDASPCSIVNDKIYYGGYMNDRNNNYIVGVAVSIPADGAGLGSNGDWEYHPIQFTNNPVFEDYTSSVTLTSQTIAHPDAVSISSTEISVNGTFYDGGIPILVRNEIIGGASKFTFEDGGEISQTGVQRHAAYNGNNTITLSADMNGKFLYFANNPNSFNSTIYLPFNNDVALPIGFTVTVVMGNFSGCSVYVNNNGNGDVQILVNGNGNFSTWGWGFGGDGNAGVYTIMKVDTNVWMLAGPNVWVD